MTGLTQRANHRDDRLGARSAPPVISARAIAVRVAVVPPSVIAVLGAGVTAFFLVTGSPPATVRLALAGAGAGVVVALVAAVYAASAATRQMYGQIRTVRSLTVRGHSELQQQVRRILAGEQPAARVAVPARATDTDPFRQLMHELEQLQYIAEQAVLRLAIPAAAGTSDQRVEIFVNLARRMQSLVHREIELLDELEAKVEDPELLKGLFTVDHLATRMRRQSESLAVLGGATSRRQWARQVTMHEVLRAAVAEVEQYSRVKVVPPVEGVLTGSAVADVIHLIAELIENATKFSPPRAEALLRAQRVTAGLAVEVEDRGLGMLADDRDQMNALLADPTRVNVTDLLRDGRIGLFVVASLARRHGIKVQVQANIYGGIQAVVVIPNVLLDAGDGTRQLQRPDSQQRREPEPAAVLASSVQAAVSPAATAAGSARPSLPARHAAAAARADDGQRSAAAGTPGAAITGLGARGAGAPGAGIPGAGAHGAAAHGAAAPGFADPGAAASAPAASDAAPGGARSGAPAQAASTAAAWASADPASPASAAADPAASAWTAATPPSRPPLPKRKVQTHMAPELRDRPATGNDEPPADQMTGLMADFRKGMSRFDEEDSATAD